MLKIKNLTLELQKKIILNNLSFTIKENEITVIIGKNGSGKSSLVQTINGIYKYQGEISYKNKDLKTFKTKEKAKIFAVLAQRLETLHIKVFDLISLGRNPYLGLNNKLSDTDLNKINEAISLLQIEYLKECYLDKISGGELQKAYLAMLVAQDTELLILDEPTTFLDVDFEYNFLSIIKDIKIKKNKTILLILHNLTNAIEIADNIILLDNGEIKFNGTKEECIKNNIIEQEFNLKKYYINEKIFFAK